MHHCFAQMSNCPVTREPWRDPRVLPCGHSIEGTTIRKLQHYKCPLCRRHFDPSAVPVNYALAELLHLEPVNKPLYALDRVEFTRFRANRDELGEQELSLVLTRMERHSEKGHTKYQLEDWSWRRPFYCRPKGIKDFLAERLRSKGFHVAHVPQGLLISWALHA